MSRRFVGPVVGISLVFGLSASAQEKKANVDAALDGVIKQAVDKGVDFLRKNTAAGAVASGTGLPIAPGGQALIGWTLLECGVPADDPLVQKLAEAVRSGIIDHEAYYGTYNLSTALIFLDKLADPADAPLIESMTVRLLTAQSDKHGGWGYPAPYLTPVEKARLKAVLKERRETLARGEPVKDSKRTPEQKLQDMRRYVGKLIDPYGGGRLMQHDNSNTQFAMMALWVARRHDLPVGAALVNVGKRFRTTQTADGAWTYVPGPTPGKQTVYRHPAMTCAGLLALALDKGAQNKTKDDLEKDDVAKKGFAYLGKHLANPGGDAAPFPNPLRGNVPPAAPANPLVARGLDRGGNYYYFLFSLERMAVVYDLAKIGEVDWYAWGAEDLVNHQAANGSWTAAFPEWHADTCFALLFLKRANVARDLTDNFNRRPGAKTPMRDPLLDLPFILPKDEKRRPAGKTIEKKQSSINRMDRSTPVAGPTCGVAVARHRFGLEGGIPATHATPHPKLRPAAALHRLERRLDAVT
jgi:hypothetical protein